MKRFLVELLCVILVAPAFAFASDMPAGFAPGAVWLSKTALEDGQSVQFYTVLYDSASDAIAGNVSFLVDGSSISSQPFELAAGTTKIVSTTWKAAAGVHSITASLDGVVNKDTGEALMLGSTQAAPVSIEVASPPPPPAAMQALSAITDTVQQNAPAVIAAAQSAYNSLEYLRQNAVHALEGQLAAASNATGVSSNAVGASVKVASDAADKRVLGASTANLTAAKTGGGDFFGVAWRTTLRALLFVCQLRFLFYASLLIVIFILYKMMRTLLFERRHPYRD